MFSFSDNHKSIKEINTMFSSGSLIVDESYQRRSVWGEKDKIRLIETILLKLVIPEVFFWKAETDPETGESVTHIVDGQQRIKAISSFIDNDYKLKSQYLLDEEIKEKYGNKFFKDLDPEVKTAFWNYRLMIIEISQESTKEEIVQVFRRLNLTDFNLNDQEKRNSISGDFAALARDLSENEIWEEKHLFNNKHICDAIIELRKFIEDDEILKFVKRKAQLYTVFSVIFYLQREDENVTDVHVEKLKNFVKLYSVFDNDMDMDGKLSDEEKNIYDMLKKYKLASSEGLNKHTNRMIRYNVLKDFLCDKKNTDDIQAGLYDKIVNYVEER